MKMTRLVLLLVVSVTLTVAPARPAEMILDEGIHTQFEGKRIKKITLRKKPVFSQAPIAPKEWPGKPIVSAAPVDELPFAPGTVGVVSTITPEFTWPPCEGAVSYKIYISKKPLSAANTILAEEVTGTSYQSRALDFAQLLRDGGTYIVLVRPRDAKGRSLVPVTAGAYGEFSVRLTPVKTVAPGEIDLVRATLNDMSSVSFERIAIIDREKAPDGILTLVGRLSTGAGVSSVSITYDSGLTWVPITLSGTDFTHSMKMTEGFDYRIALRINLGSGEILTRRLPGDLEILRFINLTQRQQIQKVLDNLVAAFVQNDRAMLLSLLDPAYISKEPGFTDYQEFQLSIREQFNRTTTSTARWSLDNYEIISPDNQVNVTFSWQQRINYSRYNDTRDVNVTARLNMRKINGVWKIHSDLDRKIFVRDLGILPNPPE